MVVGEVSLVKAIQAIKVFIVEIYFTAFVLLQVLVLTLQVQLHLREGIHLDEVKFDKKQTKFASCVVSSVRRDSTEQSGDRDKTMQVISQKCI